LAATEQQLAKAGFIPHARSEFEFWGSFKEGAFPLTYGQLIDNIYDVGLIE
jgi:hypothetical protein